MRLRGDKEKANNLPMIARKYLYLIALAKEKHFGRAATACNVSTSTLSAAIRDLEAEVGVAVVERGQHFTGLTPEGLRVLDYAQRMAASAEALRQDLASLQGGLSGQLRLGVIPTALTRVAELTTSFARHHPLTTIQVRSLPTIEIVQGLRNYEFDAGIVYSESAGDADLAFQPLWVEGHVLITDAERFPGQSAIGWAEAAALPLCLLTPDMQNRKITDKVFAELGHPVTPRLETDSILGMLAHIFAGPWSGIAPSAVLDLIGTPAGLCTLDLRAPTVAWATGMITLARDPAPSMVTALREEARALQAPSGKDE
jgi:DNA-binding transcriptional LysR family regulator